VDVMQHVVMLAANACVSVICFPGGFSRVCEKAPTEASLDIFTQCRVRAGFERVPASREINSLFTKFYQEIVHYAPKSLSTPTYGLCAKENDLKLNHEKT